jgi:hypothetical protein
MLSARRVNTPVSAVRYAAVVGVLEHRCAGQHPEDRVECAVRNNHWPEAAGCVPQVPVEDSSDSENSEEQRHHDQPVAGRVIRGGQQHQRQVPHAVEEADNRRRHPRIPGSQLRQHVAAPADLLEEGEERDDDNVDGEVDCGVRRESPGHPDDQGCSGIRGDEHGRRTKQGQRPVAPAGAVQG